MAVTKVRTEPDLWMQRLSGLALGLGILLRLVLWLQDRSLFIDEANLMRNLVERPYFGFFRGLDYHQYAPPLFCMLEKGILDLLGVSSRAGRLLPLLAGIGSLFLFRRVAARLLPAAPAAFALLFLALGEPFFRYATEVKQYATDLLTTLALVSLALSTDTRRWWLLGIAGSIAVWWSMPSIFVLPGIGAYLLGLALRPGSPRRLIPLAGCSMAWVLSFAAYYLLLLRNDIDAPGLQQAHEFFRVQDMLLQLRGLGTTAVGYVFFSDVVFWTGFAGGLYGLLRRWKPEGLLLVVPLVCCLTASGLGFYPMTERLTLFLMPLLLLLLGMGWGMLLQIRTRWVLPAMLVMVLLAGVSRNPLRYFIQPYQVVNVREALVHLQNTAAPSDRIYAHPDTGPVAVYYTQLAQQRISLEHMHISKGNAAAEVQALDQTFPESRLWILWNASDDFPDTTILQDRALKERIDFAGCRLYLFSASE